MSSGLSELHTAIKANDIARARQLIASGQLDVNARGFKCRPLVSAAEFGRLEIVAALLDAGADIDVTDDMRNTACHLAVDNNHALVLHLLISRGADLLERNARGHSLIHMAMYVQDDAQCAVMLLVAGVPLKRLIAPLRVHFTAELLRQLLVRNIDMRRLRERDGSTPCHALARLPELTAETATLMRELVTVARVDIDAFDENGKTACHYAAQHASNRMLCLLIQLGADVDRRSRRGWAPLQGIISRPGSSRPCSTALLAAGADVFLADIDGSTACHEAALARRFDTLCELLAAGADFDQPDLNGNTPRQFAIEFGCPLPSAADIEVARRELDVVRLGLVRNRAFEICVALQTFNLDALLLCEIMTLACGESTPVAPLVPLYQWWKIAARVISFGFEIQTRRQEQEQEDEKEICNPT
jgi:ankyrin repeat protein